MTASSQINSCISGLLFLFIDGLNKSFICVSFLIYIKNILLSHPQICIIIIDAMARIKNQKNKNVHLVLISDENGIFDAFLLIKKVLIAKTASCLSLVYAIPKQKQHPLFEQELTFLEKRFSQGLLVYKVAIDPDSCSISQEFIEALINSNLSEKMTFLLFGNDEFISSLSEILDFLNAKQITKIKIIK